MRRAVRTFYRRSHILNAAGLAAISNTVQAGGYGLVLISSWQSVVRGLIRDENDNAGAVRVVEEVKAIARRTGVPWLIDAHAGKGEDQSDDADPSRAMRGASGAQGAVDYTLWLRYGDGAFGSRRRLSGKGRFVNFAPINLDYDVASGLYTALGATMNAGADHAWRRICETCALTTTPRTVGEIARAAGLTGAKNPSTAKRAVEAALRNRGGIGYRVEARNGKNAAVYYLLSGGAAQTDQP